MTSKERGRIPGSVGVPVTVYVLPEIKERERGKEREEGEKLGEWNNGVM